MRFTLVLLIAIGLLLPCSYCGAQSFDMEERFEVPVPIPQQILRYLESQIGGDFERMGCSEDQLSEVLEATEIRLSKRGSAAIIVKPFKVCACAVHTCPFWIFLRCQSGFCPAGKIDAGILTVRKQKSAKGLYQLDAWAGTAGWSYKGLYSFNGKEFREIKRWDWSTLFGNE